MGDLFSLHTGIPLLGTSASPKTLTNSYSDSNSGILDIGRSSFVELGINYTMGAAETANSIEVKYEVSNDASTYYRLQTVAAVSGTVTRYNREDTFTAVASAGTYDHFPVSLEGIGAWKYLKVSVKETGISSNGGSCWIEATKLGR